MKRINVLARFGILALPLAAAMVPVTQAAAGSGISVFVGYADSIRAAGEFPNPWDGAPNVTFDGCTPAAACTFDAGSVRVYNSGTSTVHVDQVSVHIGSCLYTWNGPRYPVTLAPQASLIVTQRAPSGAPGCTGPDPASFDSSDVPAEVCANDGIQPTVDVTVDGATTSGTDSGQVLNTGGVDPGVCTNTNESTNWVGLGSRPCPGQGLSLAPANQTHAIATTATVSATFTNSCGSSLSGVLVNFKVTAGPNMGVSGSGITDASGSATFTYSSLLAGTDDLQATVTNAAGFVTTSNGVTVIWTVGFAPGGGSFVIGDNDAVLGSTVNFWGAQWAKQNSLSGGPAPRSFKGFAEAPASPTCGASWTADPGNSTPPPAGPLPEFMGVIVTSSAHQSGSQISGDIVEIVIVKTNPGYEPNPGHAATGTVMSVVCGGPVGHAGASRTHPKVTSKGVTSGSTSLPPAAPPGTRPSSGPAEPAHHTPGQGRAHTTRGLRATQV